VRSATLLVVALAAAPAAAQSTQEFFRVTEIRRGDSLSIRERPDADGAVVARIPANTRHVRGFGCTNETPSGHTWCRVKYGDAVGWARRRYLAPE
jgi:hypothetical protein